MRFPLSYRFLLLLGIFGFFTTYSQDRFSAEKDSLLHLVTSGKPDSVTVSNLITLGTYIQLDYRDSGLIYFNKAREISYLLNKPYCIAMTELFVSGHYINYAGNLDSGFTHVMKSLEVSRKNNIYYMSGQAYEQLAFIYNYYNNFDSLAAVYYDSAFVAFEKSGATGRCIDVLIKKSDNLSNRGKLDESMKLIQQAIKMERESEMQVDKKNLYVGIGNSLVNNHQLDSAVRYYSLALDIANEQGDPRWISFMYSIIGTTYGSMHQYALALEHAQKGLDIAVKFGLTKERLDNLWAFYAINYDNNHFKEALEYYEKHRDFTDSMAVASKDELINNYDKELQMQQDQERLTLLQKDNELKESNNRQQQLINWFSLAGLLSVIVFAVFMYQRWKLTKKQNEIIESQKLLVDEKNKEITDSINYAKRIQNAILPPVKSIYEKFSDAFVWYQPKDIVAGDFYWLEENDQQVLLAAADCTGHGVPGAMVSVICHNGLNRSVREFGLKEPGKILDKTRELIVTEFAKSDEGVQDGMDICLCAIEGNQLRYAGANNPLWIIRKGSETLEEIKADKQPVGKFDKESPYTTHVIQLNPGDTVYLFTDGLQDQFGGDKGKKFKASSFKKLLQEIVQEPLVRQKQLIQDNFESWKGNLEQVDDVCVIGVRI